MNGTPVLEKAENRCMRGMTLKSYYITLKFSLYKTHLQQGLANTVGSGSVSFVKHVCQCPKMYTAYIIYISIFKTVKFNLHSRPSTVPIKRLQVCMDKVIQKLNINYFRTESYISKHIISHTNIKCFNNEVTICCNA